MFDLSQLRPRMLMGPGPSDVHPRVLEAMRRPTIGHLDSQMFAILNDIRQMLQAVFQTRNEMTLAVSGTGSAGMEACLANLLEPGDAMLVCSAGAFGQRMREMAARMGARVAVIEAPWGRVFTAGQVRAALEEQGPFKLVGIVHAETSTGAAQPIEPVARVVHETGALLLVDAVTSLGGMELNVDGWGIDACYSGTQKCLSCPPGLAPVTFGPAALEALRRRRQPVQSWYLDLSLVGQYWGSERLYHHTAPINMSYALHEALRLVLEEGLEKRWARHARAHERLKGELNAMGIHYLADAAHCLPMLNAVAAPEGVDEALVRRRLVEDYGIEIGGGLGSFKGKAWRIGLMGESATERHVDTLAAALREILSVSAD